jgi:SPP1 gp7 family putative phage head morphogenesis protein
MNNRDYWAARALQREQEAYLRGEELSAKLFQEYQRAARELRKAVNDFYARYATKHGLTYEQAVRLLTRKEMQEWRAALGEYVAQINATADPKVRAAMIAQLDALSANSRISRLEALQGQVDQILNGLYDKGVDQMRQGFGDLYRESYYHKHYDLQSRAGWLNEITKLDAGMVESAVNYPWSGAMFSDRLWRNKDALLFNLRETITQGLIQGKGLAETSKSMAAQLGQSYKVAERLVRTETNHLHNGADRAAYEAAGVEEYEYMATLDSRTSAVCADLDGKHFKLKDAQPGTNYPPMHPNCRSTTVEYDPEDAADWAASGAPMPKRMTYEEWAEAQDVPVEIEKIRMVESARDKVYNQGVTISDKQFGKKVGKHASDFGLDPSDKGSREKMRAIIQDIAKNRDEIVRGSWRGLGKVLESGSRASGPADFLIKGRDVVVAQNGRFVTILRDGVTNPHVKEAKKKGDARR